MKSHRNIPFGYMMRGGEIVLHPEESTAVREVFDNRDRTMKIIDLLTRREPLDTLDIELAKQIVRAVHINKGIATVELINGKMITA